MVGERVKFERRKLILRYTADVCITSGGLQFKTDTYLPSDNDSKRHISLSF
jgi:hypothetical protein